MISDKTNGGFGSMIQLLTGVFLRYNNTRIFSIKLNKLKVTANVCDQTACDHVTYLLLSST